MMSERCEREKPQATALQDGTLSMIFSLKKEKGALVKALQVFDGLDILLSHIESRPSKSCPGVEYDFYVDCHCPREKKEALMEKLRHCSNSVINVLAEEAEAPMNSHISHRTTEAGGRKVPWFPRTIHEVQRCCTRLYKYGGELSTDHPGYGDPTYRDRRKHIAQLSMEYKYGSPIPRLEYTEEEIRTWGAVFTHQTKLYSTHACKEFNAYYPDMFETCGYRKDNIPQLEDVSRYLKAKTRWQLWPVIGWISSRDFLNALAFRVFPSSQYIRHSSSPLYTPEPDICHELIGHAPLFCDPSFAQFSQEVGLASLGVSDEWIKKLASLYWFTVEFGMVKEGDKLKAYGAGLLSGSQELQYCTTNKPQHREFNIDSAMATRYPETGLQPLYFVVHSLDDMRDKMMEFAKTIPREFSLSYDPYTQSVVTLDSASALEKYAGEIKDRVTVLHGALRTQSMHIEHKTSRL